MELARENVLAPALERTNELPFHSSQHSLWASQAGTFPIGGSLQVQHAPWHSWHLEQVQGSTTLPRPAPGSRTLLWQHERRGTGACGMPTRCVAACGLPLAICASSCNGPVGGTRLLLPSIAESLRQR